MTLTLPHEAAFAREIRRSMAQDIVWFTQHYFRDEDGAKLHLKWFHTEMLEKCADERIERLLLLEPAGFGKTTNVGKHYPLHVVCVENPKCQLVYGGKSATDAESRLSAMKAELEGNEELINDFGPFIGPTWRDDALMLARGNHNVKDPTISAVGSTSSIFGRRATHFIGDDMVTNLNSGSHVKPETRERFAADFKQGIQKIAYAGKPLYIRLVNTVVDQRDMLHELGDINQHNFTDTTWTSTKRYFVIRRPALDEINMTSLWPERRSVESLLEEKAEDLIAFEKRMQNRTLDPSMMNFQRIWFDGDPGNPEIPGCLDYGRCIHVDPSGDGVPALTRVGGYDPNAGAVTSTTSKFCGFAEVVFDRRGVEPRTYWITDLARFRATLPDQETFLCDRLIARNMAMLHIEDNAANQWLLQLPKLKGMKLSGYRIEGFNTNVKTKYDPDTGVPALAGMIRGGKIRFPYHCARCREMTEIIIGEFLSYPQGATTDLIMAVWFAILAANKVALSARNGIIDRVISPFLAHRGISAASAQRFFPPRNIVNP